MQRVQRYFRAYTLLLGSSSQRLPRIVLLMLFVAALDLAGLAAILPLLAVFIDPKSKGSLGIGGPDASFGIFESPFAALGATLVVFAIFVFRAWLAIRVNRKIIEFSGTHHATLMRRVLEAYLHQPYEFFLRRNSADFINLIVHQTYLYISSTLTPSLKLLTDSLSVLVIFGFLCVTISPATLLPALILLGTSALFVRIMQHRLRDAGRVNYESSTSLIKTVQHVLGSIKEVRVLASEAYWLGLTEHEARRLAGASAQISTIQAMPRYLIELSLVALFLICVGYTMFRPEEAGDIASSLAILAVAGARLMPGLVGISTCLNSLRSNTHAVERLAEDLEILTCAQTRGGGPPGRSEAFSELEFRDVTYAYPDTEVPAIERTSFKLLRGQTVGMLGSSGAGKSTLADLMLGLLVPQAGEIFFNGRPLSADRAAWLRCCAYVPQGATLIDDTVRRNVAFGVDDADVDDERVRGVCEVTRIWDVIKNLPEGLDARIGERGVRLSGGQRQRLAIARALYHRREFIVLDEATSALDADTEREVARALRDIAGKCTLIVVTHRPGLLRICDYLLHVENRYVRTTAQLRSAEA